VDTTRLRSNKCPRSSNAFFCEPRGSHAPEINRPGPKPGLCCVLAGVQVMCIGGSAGAALCVEEMAVLRDGKEIWQCCIIILDRVVVFDGWLTDERFLHIL